MAPITMEVPSTQLQGRLQSKFKKKNSLTIIEVGAIKLLKNFFVLSPNFHILNKNCCNWQTCTSIRLIFGNCTGGPKINPSKKFGVNLITIPTVMNDLRIKQS